MKERILVGPLSLAVGQRGQDAHESPGVAALLGLCRGGAGPDATDVQGVVHGQDGRDTGQLGVGLAGVGRRARVLDYGDGALALVRGQSAVQLADLVVHLWIEDVGLSCGW